MRSNWAGFHRRAALLLAGGRPIDRSLLGAVLVGTALLACAVFGASPTAVPRAAAAGAAAACTQAQWYVVPLPATDDLYGGLSAVAALAADDVWAVGGSWTGSNYTTRVLHWDGAAWEVVPSPNVGPSDFLTGVAALSPDDIWATGYTVQSHNRDGFPLAARTLAMHWDGHAWSLVHTPNTADPVNMLGRVYAFAPGDVWAIGKHSNFLLSVSLGQHYATRPLVMHWDGQSWAQVDLPYPPSDARDVIVEDNQIGTAALGPHDIWLVGGQDEYNQHAVYTKRTAFSEHWDGSSWHLVDVPHPALDTVLGVVGGVAPNDVWAMGSTDQGLGHPSTPWMLHWNGRTWQAAATPGPGGNAIGGVAPNDLWAVGESGVSHWDGSTWSPVRSLAAQSRLNAVAARTNSDVWAVGESGDFQSPQFFAAHYACSSPPLAATPTPAATATPLAVPTVALPGAGARTFPATGQTVTGLFLDYWDQHGALAQQGYPISGVLGEVSDLDGKPYTVQYFERAVFEYHPDNQPPFNVLLSQLGTFQYHRKYPAGAPGQVADQTAGHFFAETGHWVGGKFWAYWQAHGGLAQQGYPISDEFTETSDLDGQPYTVQYFERAVFELHPENAPPYDVLLSQLGTFQYRAKHGP